MRPVYQRGDRVRCWVKDGAASGWDRGIVAGDIAVGQPSLHRVWVRTETGGLRYYHQGDTKMIQHMSAVDELAILGRRA